MKSKYLFYIYALLWTYNFLFIKTENKSLLKLVRKNNNMSDTY